ncbi:MAG: bifunctional metallophosphatase/5'-nucleotidase [Lutibacter sp.]|nr:MAG: bifunctional metallophosphatase/5'-nucleotidase [Lutibacter sp.]
MKKISILLISLLFIACKKDDNSLEFIVVQVNDVYEIGAVDGGKTGGLARVANLYKTLKSENPNTLLVHGGDFLNPSIIATLKGEDGERFRGKQMIEVMNAMNFDLVAFGNHEFDLKYKDFQKRLNESNFQWIATNTQLVKDSITKTPFFVEKNGMKTDIPRTITFDFKDTDGTEIKVGFFSATIDSNPKDYVDYGDLYQDAINAYNTLKPSTDVVLGLTHLSFRQDRLVSLSLPNVPIIFGGHEHTNMLIPVGDALISKADANAKTAYVHRITFDKKTKKSTIKSELVQINESTGEDAEVAKIVQKWLMILDNKLKEIIKNPYEVIYTTTVPLDGRDTPTRSVQTNLGQLIATSMSQAFGDTKIDCAFVNGGSIRLDEELQGDITGVDIFRVLPFGGGINKVEMTGELLRRVLQYGRLRAGTGAYLQHYNIEYDVENKQWKVGGKRINKNKTYTVVMTDYLLLGFDIPFLKADAKGIDNITKNKPEDLASDIRKVVIKHLKSL